LRFRTARACQRAAEIQCQAGMIPGPDTVLPQAARDQCVTSSKRPVEQTDFARLFFDAAVHRMVTAKGKPF